MDCEADEVNIASPVLKCERETEWAALGVGWGGGGLWACSCRAGLQLLVICGSIFGSAMLHASGSGGRV